MTGELLVAVDRIEGRGRAARVVMVADDGREFEAARGEFAAGLRVAEGHVLRISAAGGALDWRSARRDRAEEARRRTAAATEMQRLRRKDPGGNLNL